MAAGLDNALELPACLQTLTGDTQTDGTLTDGTLTYGTLTD